MKSMKELKIELQVKPLSANKMYWRGKRSKTSEYLAYQNEIRDELMGTTWPFSDSPLHCVFDVGLSARQADLDNTFKPLFDTLQTIYVCSVSNSGLNVLSRSACLADRQHRTRNVEVSR